jgi:hypothetical protein
MKIYRTIILPVVLYGCGCKTWSLTLREKRKLRVFENRVLRRVFGPKRDEVTGEWRKLHNEDLNNLYSWESYNVFNYTILLCRYYQSPTVQGTVSRMVAQWNIIFLFAYLSIYSLNQIIPNLQN